MFKKLLKLCRNFQLILRRSRNFQKLLECLNRIFSFFPEILHYLLLDYLLNIRLVLNISVLFRDEHQRYGYITNQMRKCVKEFKNCGDLHWKLYQTAFDADPATLENMQM